MAVYRNDLYAGGQRDGALYRLSAGPEPEPAPAERDRHRRPHHAIGSGHHTPVGGAVCRDDAQCRQGRLHGGAHIGRHEVKERRRGRGGADHDQLGRAGDAPTRRDRPLHHARMEIVESGHHGAGGDGAERRGAGGEIAVPKASQAGVTQRAATGRSEVGDGVDGFGDDPQLAGGDPAGSQGDV